MYLGLDAWQSPNGFDILGTVIYRLVWGGSGDYELESMPLDFVRLKERHTSEYLAETVRQIVEKFGVQHKICGIVTNNTTNNQKMVNEIKKFKWTRFKGKVHWVQCFAHILNLIVQVILRRFGSYNKERNTEGGGCNSDKDKELDDLDQDEPEHQIQLYSQTSVSIILANFPNDSANHNIAAELIEEDELELENEDINDLSDEDKCDAYTSQSCKKTLAKFRAIALKLKKLPNSKALFVEICQEENCTKPHSVERDVRTRWNSTLVQLTSIQQCSPAILEWQKDKQHGTSRAYHINQNNLDLARDLVNILEPFYDIT
ncbi:hypothetical protein PTTG_27292 [Puccinia triticina 1-1 BBBD Race 1]|uniref:DUF659 domain-containing protein n=1 Tax=Puccinia triticina (isolate 1-1 / race 1 (BBBD)) TaxID=630390 RepID=A0A180GL36_PUCT1|nr:hypothetical protein PTTG_27292 [Puccinia triticina 1-1 BBBD Race 1]